MLSHRNLAVNAEVLHRYWQFRPGDGCCTCCRSFTCTACSSPSTVPCLNGTPMFFEPKFDAKRALALLPRTTVFMGVPTYYVRLLAEPGFTRELCANVRLFVSGSAPLLKETFDEFKARTGHTILERYGMTEGNMFTSNPYDGERRGGTVGFPLPGVSVRIVDDEDRPVKAGEIGRIQVKGENVFRGYWRMPEKTQRGVHRRRLLPDRRHGHGGRRRLHFDHRPVEGPDHHRRAERLPEGDRGGDRRHARRRGNRRDRRPPSRFRRGGRRGRRAPGQRTGRRS